MSMHLTTDVQLAEQFGLSLDKFHDLRKRKHWPCVRLGRFEYRFTDAQVEQIVALHTQSPAKKTASAGKVPGQTGRSAARSKS